MKWLSFIFRLIPYLTAGINVIHKDLGIGDKTKIATDLVSLGTQAAIEVNPGDSQLEGAIGQNVNSSIESITTALHRV
ncbi:MAG: hypothetical protein ACREOZ_04075 [Gloeomargaritales cyanobacterium]